MAGSLGLRAGHIFSIEGCRGGGAYEGVSGMLGREGLVWAGYAVDGRNTSHRGSKQQNKKLNEIVERPECEDFLVDSWRVRFEVKL